MAEKDNVRKSKKKTDLKSQEKELGKEMEEPEKQDGGIRHRNFNQQQPRVCSKELDDLKSVIAAMENSEKKLESKLREINVKPN